MSEEPSTSSIPAETGATRPGLSCAADLLAHPGDVVGHFKLLELLGEGGFGIVWLAEQSEPVRRRVALKLIKPGMDSKVVIARFEAERQALALMNHPNIAKVLDAGTAPASSTGSLAGRPYFVMEHVKGSPITEYCDTHRLTIAQRLRLFAMVCDAVQHAHTRGIIHRDLKPSNILVTISDESEPRPVVIDFGVAKALTGRLSDQTIFTERGQIIGTPEYMSPEQAEMAETDIDTRSDVYSLGVILYELLTGAVPFDSRTLRAAGYAAIQKMIREADPPRPSTRLSAMGSNRAIAAARQAQLDDLASQLRQELEWIPLKALKKDRSERYRSASELADDVENYLSNRPLIAGPENATYKVRKFVRRNKVAVFAGGVVAASLVAATAVSVWFGIRESVQRAEAVRQKGIAEANAEAETIARKRAENINDFVTKALQSSDPQAGGKQDVTIAEAMQNAIKEIDAGAFKDDPQTEAALKDTIANILANNGHAELGEPLLVQAMETLRSAFKGDHQDVAKSMNNLANVRLALGRAAEAEPLNVKALEMYQRLLPGDSADVAGCLNNVAFVRQTLGRPQEAEPLLLKALEMRKRMYRGDNSDVAESLNNLAGVRQSMGHSAEAEPLCAEALEMYRRLYKGDHPDIALTLNNLAFIRDELGRGVEAEVLYAESLAMRRRLFSGDHPQVAAGLNNLAQVRQALGRATEAEPLFDEALAMQRRIYKGDHSDVMATMSNIADLRKEMGRASDAEPLFKDALEMSRRLYKGDHPDLATCLSNLGLFYQGTGRAAQAEPLLVESIAMRRRVFAGDHPLLAIGLNNLALAREDLGRKAEAESQFVDAIEMYRRVFKGDHPSIASTICNLAIVRQSLGKSNEARRDFDAAIAMLRRVAPAGSPDLARALSASGAAHLNGGEAAIALVEIEESVALGKRLLPPEHPKLKEYVELQARCRVKLGK